jgi:predicted glutamine amidotransferase
MCRWIAYQGDTIALEHYVTEPAHSLISQSISALESTAATNGDGFGLGWYDDEHPEPGVYRELRPAWSDENLRYLCRHLRSRLFFAHVRASTGTAVTRSNCHPFTCKGWLFMHNGSIGNWTRVRRKVEALIPDELYPARVGTTDSEATFLAMLGAGLEADPVGATAWTLAELTSLVSRIHTSEPLRFTSALTNGRDLYAFRYAANARSNSLYYQSTNRGAVVVSEPLDSDRSNWTPVPENHALVSRAGAGIEILPLDMRSGNAPPRLRELFGRRSSAPVYAEEGID